MPRTKTTAIRVTFETHKLACDMSDQLIAYEGKPDHIRQTGPGHAIRRSLEIVQAHLENRSVILTKDIVARLFQRETALHDEVTRLRQENDELRDERNDARQHERQTMDRSWATMKRDGQRIATLQGDLKTAEELTTALQNALETYAQAGVLLARGYAAELSGDEDEELAQSLWQTAGEALEAAMAGETADALPYLRSTALRMVVDNETEKICH